LEPSNPTDALGTEDPRVSYDNRTGTYYLFYTAVAQGPNGSVSANLALATATSAPTRAGGWTQHGYVFPQLSWSKSGALLILPPDRPSLLFWGDSTLVPGLQVAKTYDMINYIYNASIWLPVRPDSFDSVLVEAGPEPLALSDGSWLFLYNSARQWTPTAKPGWSLQYNVGWVILDQHDPLQIIQRCQEPIISPTLAWETGVAPSSGEVELGLTPNVVFLEGWQRYPGFSDAFIVYLGGADSVVGAAQLLVQVPAPGAADRSYRFQVRPLP
jgi:predicted GH43/DUF377 family glycosyl hydrolase